MYLNYGLKNSLSTILFFASSILIAGMSLYQMEWGETLLLVACVSLYWVNRFEPNISGLLLILIGTKALKVLLVSTLFQHPSSLVYLIEIASISLVVYLIGKRTFIAARWELFQSSTVTKHKLVYTNADYLLATIYKVYLMICAVCFVEYLIHYDFNLVRAEHAIQYLEQGCQRQRWFYILNTRVEILLYGIEFIAIMLTSHRLMRSGRYFCA